mgnify:CR=1 FL=1
MMTHWGFCLVRLICWIPEGSKLILDGAPEFAGQIGNFMFAVADYAKG